MTHIGTQTIQTPHLLLRHFREQDAPAMFQNWANDPRVTRWMRWEPHKDADETRTILRGWVPEYARPDYYHWCIALREGPAGDSEIPIGSIGVLHSFESDDPHLWEPGYCIGLPWWNHGYTTEALEAVLDYFIQGTGIAAGGPDKLICSHATENPASGRVMQKAGFVYEREGVYHRFDGTPVPACYYVYPLPGATPATSMEGAHER